MRITQNAGIFLVEPIAPTAPMGYTPFRLAVAEVDRGGRVIILDRPVAIPEAEA